MPFPPYLMYAWFKLSPPSSLSGSRSPRKISAPFLTESFNLQPSIAWPSTILVFHPASNAGPFHFVSARWWWCACGWRFPCPCTQPALLHAAADPRSLPSCRSTFPFLRCRDAWLRSSAGLMYRLQANRFVHVVNVSLHSKMASFTKNYRLWYISQKEPYYPANGF